MIDARRQAYLEAMGIDVWVARPPAPEPGELVLGCGGGSTLLVCADAAELESGLVADITRALGGSPLWAWPNAAGDTRGDAEVQQLKETIDQRLITQLVIFGEQLASLLCAGAVPGMIGSAAVHLCPPLDELAVRGTAKKKLWQVLLQHREDAAA